MAKIKGLKRHRAAILVIGGGGPQAERVVAGGHTLDEVAQVKITVAGRRVLAESRA